MLTVDVEKRFTLEDCMNHPWMHGHSGGRINHSGSAKIGNPNDSTGGLVGGIADLDFEKRRVQRERTLLASINEVLVAKKINVKQDGKNEPVPVFVRNPNKERMVNKNHQHGGKRENAKEAKPDAERNVKEFEKMGGQGDAVLFEDDPKSNYPGRDVAKVKDGR